MKLSFPKIAALVVAGAVSAALATAALPADAATVPNLPCTTQLTFTHTAGVGYWGNANTSCTSRAYNIEVEVKQNGLVMLHQDITKPFVSGVSGAMPYAFSAVHGANYQIVEIFYDYATGYEIGWATSGTPQVFA